MLSPLRTAVRRTTSSLLSITGIFEASPSSAYAEGATTPLTVPIFDIPKPIAPAGLDTNALANGEAEALGSEATQAAPLGLGALSDIGGLELNEANIESILDDMIRPALHADGGDIALVKIENDDVYVRLVGACSTCPSSVMTMRMGVERLLQDEFPQMGELIAVDMPLSY